MQGATPFRDAIQALAAGEPDRAIPLLGRAIETGDQPILARLNLGMALGDLGRFQEAAPLLEQAAADLPDMAEPWFRLGSIAAQSRDHGRAEACLHKALVLDPAHMLAMVALSAVLVETGRAEDAEVLLQQACAMAPEEPELRLFAAQSAARRGDWASVIDNLLVLLALRPAHVPGAKLLAETLIRQLGNEAALAFLAGHAAAAPLAAAWPFAASIVLALMGRAQEALAELRTAEALAPDQVDIICSLAKVLAAQGVKEEAEQKLRQAFALRPNDVELICQLATVLLKGQRLQDMSELLDDAITRLGEVPSILVNRALVLYSQGRQAEALEYCDRGLVQHRDRTALTKRAIILSYHPERGTAEELLAAARDVDNAMHYPTALPCPQSRDPDRKLRIGLLSGCFGIHPVGWLTLAAFEALPADQFEIACYCLKPRQDPMADRFRARADIWRDVAHLSDAHVADTINRDQVDILIDLGGYGDGGSFPVMTFRAAPVQVKWVGAQFATMGLRSIDWMITDRWETPEGFERFYTERLLRMPDGYVCYSPPPYAADVAPLPALTNGYVTFGCFNNLAKVTPRVLAVWARILAAVPDSRFMLRTHALGDAATREYTHARMTAAGIPMERVELLSACKHPQLLADYGRMDIGLEPFPYSGGLTACEALWMGVPLIGLAGDSFASRHAYSHLSNVGLDDWITWNEDDYVAQAVARASDLPALAALRAGLRARVAASPLTDAPRFGLNLGHALRRAWREWCAG